MTKNKLNIGCGNEILADHINLDLVNLHGVDVVHNLDQLPWPFEDNQFEGIRMINVLEHLPDTIKTVEEVWRISKPGSKVIIRSPYWNCWQAIGDPTHIHSFHQTSFDFFDPAKKNCKDRPYYSKARFKVREINYWIPFFPSGKGWVKINNSFLKAPLSILSMYFNNIVWLIEFELIALK